MFSLHSALSLINVMLFLICCQAALVGADVHKASSGKEAFKKLATELLGPKADATKLRLGILSIGSSGGGKLEEQVSAAARLARAELEQAFSANGHSELISRDQLADLETEGIFQNKKIDIKGVEALVRGTLFYKGKSVSIHAELVLLDGKTNATAIEVDPEFLGLPRIAPEETELPPALAAVRIADQTLFDIRVAQVKINGIKVRLAVPPSGTSAEDAAALKSVLTKALQTRESEQQVGAEKVLSELSKLAQLEVTIVGDAFKERRSDILLKGAEEGIDTELQRKLLGKLEDLYMRAKKSGLKLSKAAILALAKESDKL